MGYSLNNPPRDVVQLGFTNLPGGSASTSWLYESTDAHTVVGTPGYISNAGKLGMKLGDLVIVRHTPTGEVTQHSVLALAAPTESRNPPGAASLSRISAGYLTPASLAAGTTNNFEPRSDLANPMSAFDRMDLDPASGNATLTGMTAGLDLQTMYWTNTNAVNSVTLAAQSALSLAANRFAATIILGPGVSALLVYNAGTINRWTRSSLT
jgi:hypothetical protein